MPNLSELFTTLATRAGVDVKNAEFVAVVSNPELTKITVPDALNTSITSGLHTLESAESVIKPKLEKQFKAEVYNGVDADLFLQAKEFGFEDADVEELKKAEKTTSRIKLLATKIKDLESKKAGATGSDKKELIEQINTLKAHQGDLAKAHQAALAAKDQEAAGKINNFAIDVHFNGYDYEDSKPKNVNVITGKTLVQQAIAELGGVPTYNEKTGQIELKKQDGTDVFDPSNNKVTYKSITDKVLADAKLLKISGQQGNGNNGQQQTQTKTVTTGDVKGLAAFEAAMDSAIKDVSGAK
jgi:hypothetical protein